MRRVCLLGLALLVIALAHPGAAPGQEEEIALDSLEQAVDLDQEMDEMLSQFRIGGFGVGSFGYQSGTDQSSLSVTKLSLSVFKRSGAQFSFFGQLTTLFELEGSGGQPEEGAEVGEGEEGRGLETEIDNLIISFTPSAAPGLAVWFGRFDAPLGFERDDEPLNLQPTTSFNFEFARPVKLSGLLVGYTPLPQLSVAGYLVNGWDTAFDNNSGKTVGARVSFLPAEFTALSVNAVYGPEKPDNNDDQRLLLSADFTLQPVRSVILGGEFNYGIEENSAPAGGDADWIGGVLTGFLQLADGFGVTLRYDVFDDRDGSRTGGARTLQSFTVAPMLFYKRAVTGIFSTVPQTSFALPEFALRAALRYNKSNDEFFADDAGLRDDQTSVVLEGVFIF